MRRFIVVLAVLAVFLTGWPYRLEVWALEVYQKFGSPVMSYMVRCRFQPTCSQYALEALRREGFWQGNRSIGVRLLRCSPLGLVVSGAD